MEANAFLEALYNANYERLYIYAENLLFNAAYAEEAVQETFFEAVRKQDALMRHAKPEAWLMETLKNKIRVGSRRRALEALYFISLEQDLAQESKKLAVEDRPFGSINELLDAIRALLPPEDYRLLCRITLEGATHLEVAKELGISVWSSQKRLQRIRKKLCKQLLPNKSIKISENMSGLRFVINIGMKGGISYGRSTNRSPTRTVPQIINRTSSDASAERSGRPAAG